MTKFLAVALLLLLTSTSFVNGKIVEAPHFKDVVNYLSPSTLLVVDIDDTLLLPAQTLGTDVWFIYRLNQLKAQGNTPEAALDKALGEWEGIRNLTAIRIVEEGTDDILRDLQSKGVLVMGLTTQGLGLASRTVEQLKALKINLSATAPSSEEIFFFNNGHGVIFRRGILFTSGTKKGAALKTLLDQIGFKPERIVFINDKHTHLKDVEEDIQEAGIEFVGLRYSHEDQRIAQFNKDVAEIQWNESTFSHILSDQEALDRLRLNE